MPPVISRYFDGNFLTKFPVQNPVNDIMKEAIPIISVEIKRLVCVSFIVAPETSASILVAIPKLIKHFKPMHCISSCFCWNDSRINFAPSIKEYSKDNPFAERYN